MPGSLIVDRDAAVLVNASAAGRLDAWIDFNRDGDFDVARTDCRQPRVVAGSNTVFFAVPADASPWTDVCPLPA